MKLNEARVLLTGASGGIGSEVCKQLLDNQVAVYAVSRNKQKLDTLFSENNNLLNKIEADISTQSGRSEVANMLNTSNANVNVLINCAGSNQFSSISDMSEIDVIQQVNTNLVTPILLIKSLLPMLAKQDKAKIINVGSSFDSIGFPGFSVYSATKFGLRGFSESLRRELSDTNIEVSLVSPRATKTEMNSSTVEQMNKELKVKMDDAEHVAKIILSGVPGTGAETYIGWPEKIFTRINRIFPSVVDNAISKQLPVIKQYL